jgi:hypothetical protein
VRNDRGTDMTMLRVALRIFANAPKNKTFNCVSALFVGIAGLNSTGGYKRLSVARVVGCHVEAFATGRSFVQRIPAKNVVCVSL